MVRRRANRSFKGNPVSKQNQSGDEYKPAFEQKAPKLGSLAQLHEVEDDESPLDEGDEQHGDDGGGAGSTNLAEIPGNDGGSHQYQPGPMGGVLEHFHDQRIT